MDYKPPCQVGESFLDHFASDSLMKKDDIHAHNYLSFSVDSANATLQPWSNTSDQSSGLSTYPEWLATVTDTELGRENIPGGYATRDIVTAYDHMEDHYPKDYGFGHTNAPFAFQPEYTGDIIEALERLNFPADAYLKDTFSAQDFYAMKADTPSATPAYSEPDSDVTMDSQDPPDIPPTPSSTSDTSDALLVVVNLDHDYKCVARDYVKAEAVAKNTLVVYDEKKSKNVFECAVCQKRYTNSANLENHFYTEHCGIPHPWICLTCNGVGLGGFTSQTSARRHKKSIQSARTLCPKCGKSFSRPDYLRGYHKKSCKGRKKRSGRWH